MLTAIQIVYVFIAMQLESNSTGTVLNWPGESPTNPWLDPWGFGFSFIAAAGSVATAIAVYYIWKQSKLTRDQISQTQQEIDSTLRPWLGHTSFTLHPVIRDSTGQRKSYAILQLKNYGRLPARITKQVQLWKLTEITEEDLAKQPEETSPHIMIFPDQVSTYERVEEEQSHVYGANEFHFGFLLWYDFHVGEGRKEGKYGSFLKECIQVEVMRIQLLIH